MNIPVPLKLAALTLGATAFYTYVGQMVPQKEVHPPEVVEIAKDVTTAEMVEIGKGIFQGKGICQTCHTGTTNRFPNLEGIGSRAGTRVPGMTGLQYLTQTLYEPEAFIVPGFNPGMPPANKPPVGLTDDEILTVIAYLQSLGGTPTVTMETDLFAAPGDAEATQETAEVAAAADTVAGGGETQPVERFGCLTCHAEGAEAEALTGIGARLSRDQLLDAMVRHEGDVGLDQATLSDIQTLVDNLTQL